MVTALILVSLLAARPVSSELALSRPAVGQERGQAAFVSNTACAACHAQPFEQWRGSHHAKAMQPATAQTVLGNFDNTTLTHHGVRSHFFRKGDRFFVNTEGESGRYADFEVKYTFGIWPLQQYLLAFPQGRFQAFTIAWDTAKRRWFSLYPDEHIPPHDPLHWTRRHFTWNSSCAACHSTGLRLHYDPASASYHTTWAEINVSCQSCHGPGGEHVAWAGGNRQLEQKGLVVGYEALDAKTEVDTCAPCHARRYPISAHDQPGQELLDAFMPEVLREGLYHPDGQMQDEVYVYGSFLQSKMYARGVGCMDCHDPHTLQLRRAGNDLCVGCHRPHPPRQRFATLPGRHYDTPAHHFHRAGARCIDCHMQSVTYMMIDPRHDHSFRIPRPDLSVKLGVPNACNHCHIDRTAAWASAKMTEWYGNAWQKPHYGETIAAGRSAKAEALPVLVALANDPGQAAMVRATALHLLGRYGEKAHQILIAALDDEAPLVRAMAVQALETLPGRRKLAALPPLLRDPIRAVRIAAAKALAGTQLGESHSSAFAKALDEYKAAQLVLSDQPEGHANLGSLYTAMSQPAAAEEAYKTAIKRDARFFPAYNNLALLQNQQGRKAKAERTLRDAIAATGDQGVLYYSLGLLLAEQKRLTEAADIMDKASALMPDTPRVHYNHGLLLQQLGQEAKAESALRHAVDLDPDDPDVLYGLVTFYLQRQERDRAYPFAERLMRLYPDVPEFRRLVDSLKPP